MTPGASKAERQDHRGDDHEGQANQKIFAEISSASRPAMGWVN
jgi:hypothetical protein